MIKKILSLMFLSYFFTSVLAVASPDRVVDAINASLHQAVKRTADSVAKAKEVEAPKPVALIPADWLSKMTSHFTFQSEANQPLPRQRIEWYLQHKNVLVQQIEQNRSVIYSLYLQLENQSLPMELALVPLLPEGAAKSLDKPALDHLKKTYTGLLLVAAYKAGEKTLSQAQAVGKSLPFWDLPLPESTKIYMANLVALAQLLKYPDYYGLPLSSATTHSRVSPEAPADVPRFIPEDKAMEPHSLKELLDRIYPSH